MIIQTNSSDDGMVVIQPPTMSPINKALDLAGILVRALDEDNNIHGGLISRETTRKADELRIALMGLGWVA